MYYILLIFALVLIYLVLFTDLFEGKPDIGFGRESDVLSVLNRGLPITGKNKRLSLKACFRHILAVGQSGSGKSQVVFLPILLRAKGKFSYVVHDPSGEIRKSVIGFLKKIGYQIKVLNLSDFKASNFYNPLLRIDKSFASAKRLASTIVSSSLGNSTGESQFWNNKAEHLISLFILIVKQLDKKYQHIGSVLHLLNTFSAHPSSLDVFAAEYLKNPKDLLEYQTIISNDPKLLSNVAASAKAALSIWEDENLARICSKDDISFSDLRKKPMVIFLEGEVMRIRYNAPLFSLAISQLMETLLSRLPERGDIPVAILLDEMGILRLPNFSDFLSNSRKYLITCILGMQSTGQVITKYGREEGGNILANTYVQLYFGNQPLETCQMLEKMCGYEELEDENGRKEKHIILPSNRTRMLPSNEAILMVGGHKPILARLLPAYKNFVLKRRMNLPYEESIKKDSDQDIPLPFIPKPRRVK